MADLRQHHQSNNTSHSKIQFLIDEFDEELKHISGNCIDIGCGNGDQTRNILLPALDLKATIIGTDISEDIIKHAMEAHSDEERVKFKVLDIQTKNLPEEYISKFDHVFSFYTLHWCNDILQAFENIYHILRPGGTMLALMVQTHDIFDVLLDMSKDTRYTLYIKDIKKFIPPFYNSIRPEKELRTLLKNIGFKVHHCSRREKTYSVQEANKLPNVIMSFAEIFLETMRCDQIEQFKNELTREYNRRIFHHKLLRNRNERDVSDLHEILIIYALKK